MADSRFLDPDQIRARFSAALSAMYRAEVPAYGALLDLVAQVNARVLAAIGDSTPGRLTSITEFRDHLLGIGMAYSELLADEPRLMQLIVVQAAGVDQEMSQRFHRMYDSGAAILGAALRNGIDRGYIRPDLDIGATAESIVAIPFGIALRYGHKPDRDVLIAQTAAIISRMSSASGLSKRNIIAATGVTARVTPATMPAQWPKYFRVIT